jgi:hypothetical protein
MHFRCRFLRDEQSIELVLIKRQQRIEFVLAELYVGDNGFSFGCEFISRSKIERVRRSATSHGTQGMDFWDGGHGGKWRISAKRTGWGRG